MKSLADSITFGMAVLPERMENLRLSVPAILPQCDRLYIHINGATSVPDFLTGHDKLTVTSSPKNRGDLMKFCGVTRAHGYYLTLDDDILYPPDYAAKMIAALRAHNNEVLISACGSIFNPALPISGVFNRLVQVHFTEALSSPRRLMIGGTGTLGMYAPTFTITPEECAIPNMADLWVACKAARMNIPILSLARPGDWLKRLPEHGSAIRTKNPIPAIEKALDENREHFVRIYKEFLRQPDHKAAPQTPLVSVIVPTFNRPEGLQRALDGLVRQDYPNVETIVVNDGGESVDEIVNRMPESSHVFCISHKRNRGAGAARNTGLLAARGELIAYLDDDSCYFPNHIATLVTLLQSDSTAIAAYTTALHKMVRKDREGDTVVESAIIEQPFDLQNLMIANYIPLTCLMHRRAVLEETKGFAETEEVLENWDFVLRLAVNGSFAFFPKVTAETTVRIDTPHRSDLSLRYISTYRAICRRFALWAVPETRQAQEKKIRSYTDRLRHTRATLTRGEAPPSPIVPVMEGSS